MNPTASSIERVLECPASFVLPATYDAPSEHAARGTAIAAFIRDVVAGMPPKVAAESVPVQWRHTCLALNWEKLTGGLRDVRGEVAYALDTATDEVTELGLNIGRNYPKLNTTQLGGTVDIEGLSMLLDHPVVIDVKSGQPVTRAEDNPQLRFFARIAQLRHGAETVEGRIAYVDESGDVTLDVATYDTLDLDNYGDDLAGIPSRIGRLRLKLAQGEPIAVREGEHCKYCPAMNACPAYVGLARHMLPNVEQLAGPEALDLVTAKEDVLVEAVKRRFEVMSPEDIGRAYILNKRIEKLSEAIGKGIRAMGMRQDIPLPDGRRLTKSDTTKETFSHERAMGLILDLGATNEQIASCYVKALVPQVRPVGSKTGSKKARPKKKVAA